MPDHDPASTPVFQCRTCLYYRETTDPETQRARAFGICGRAGDFKRLEPDERVPFCTDGALFVHETHCCWQWQRNPSEETTDEQDDADGEG